MRLQIPSRLKIQKLIDRYPVDHIRGFNNDKVYFICHSILMQMSYKVGDNEAATSFIRLNSQQLKYYLGNQYRALLVWMINSGIIECDDAYLEGEYSKGYRLNKSYIDCTTRWLTVTHWSLYNKKKYEKYNKGFAKNSNIIKRIKKYSDSGLLTIDILKVKSKITSLVEEKYCSIENIPRNDRQDFIIERNNYQRSLLLPALSIKNNDFSIVQDDYGYRLHTPITRLKKEFRSSLKYDGKTLGEIDVKNSQLFFISYLLNYRNWKYTSKDDVNNNVKRYICRDTNIITTVNSYTLIMYLKSLEKQYGKGLCMHPFLQHVCEGSLYEKLIEKLEENPDSNKYLEGIDKRKLIKKAILYLLNADHKGDYHYNTGFHKMVWTAFNDLYPEVVNVINTIKDKDYKNISRLLHRIESTCIIKHVCNSIIKDNPNVPLFTLHDCLVTTTDNILLVRQYMEIEIENFAGFKPGLETNTWIDGNRGQNQLKAA